MKNLVANKLEVRVAEGREW